MKATEIPFSGVEELLFLLDSPAEPQNQRLEIELAGALDPTRLRAAIDEVVAHHQMLRVRLRPWRQSDRRLVWEVGEELDDDPLTHISTETYADLCDARDELLSRPFSLVRSPPFRVGLLEHGDRSHLLLVVHHTAVDGQALLTIMRELAAAYAGQPLPPEERRVPASDEARGAGVARRVA
ncbi:MAG: condensation domain-containing protein, partial [Actinomycetota bacterium]